MNGLPKKPEKPAATNRYSSGEFGAKSPSAVSALRDEEEAAHRHVAMEKDLESRANTMTALLASIMDRPATRHWGLNE